MTADPEPYLDTEALAARLGVTKETVREWARERRIRGYQPGGRHWLFRASEVDADITKSQPQAPEQGAEPTPLARRSQMVAGERVTSLREMLRQGRL